MNIFEGSRHNFQERVPKRKFPMASYPAMLPSSWQFLGWRATILQITGQYMPQSLPSPNLVIKSRPFSGDNAPRLFRSSLATELRGGQRGLTKHRAQKIGEMGICMGPQSGCWPMDLCNTRSCIFRKAVDQPCYRGPPSFMYKTVCESVCGGKTSAYERSICKKNIFAVCSYFLSVKAIRFKFSTEKLCVHMRVLVSNRLCVKACVV